MKKDVPLWALTAQELAAGFRADTFSPMDVVESVLARIEAVNPLINAVVTLDAAGARQAASDATHRHRRGAARGPLDGIPLTVKDNIPVKGLRATWGSNLLAKNIPGDDELPIARLREAGVVVLGKTNCPEFTLQGYTGNLVFGVTRNPWNLDLTPGGSSGGAVAAVAAGFGPIAIATDGGGSIRRPTSHTGLVGLKPSRGRVPRCDGFPSILLDFETIGPIARSVADVAMVMSEISRPDARDPASSGFTENPFVVESPRQRRILYVPRFGNAPVDSEIAASVRAAARRLVELGHVVDEGVAPFDLAPLEAAWPVLSQSGVAWLNQNFCPFDERVSQALREMADAGRKMSSAQYLDALMATRRLEKQLCVFFERYDFIMTPSAAALPWPAEDVFPPVIAGEPVGGRGHAVFTAFVNMSGCAGINVPCGVSRAGLPIGLQFVAAAGKDGALVSMAASCEEASLWTAMPPHRVPHLARVLPPISAATV